MQWIKRFSSNFPVKIRNLRYINIKQNLNIQIKWHKNNIRSACEFENIIYIQSKLATHCNHENTIEKEKKSSKNDPLPCST